MSTINQLNLSWKRIKKNKKIKTPALRACPQRKGQCIKVSIRKPKKPNSAQRKVVRIELTTGKKITVYIPGQGHNLQPHSWVLIRGGRVRDLPGIKYKAIRGKYDFTVEQVLLRASKRSKYSVKNWKKKMDAEKKE